MNITRQVHLNCDDEERTKPELTGEDIHDILQTFYGFGGETIEQMNGYDDLNYYCGSPKINENRYLKTLWPHGYILKVINAKDSRDKSIHKAQTSLMLFLRKRDIRCSVPVKNRFGHYFSVEDLPIKKRKGEKQSKHIIKLLEFEPGKLLKHVTNSLSIYYELGAFAAKLNIASKNFYHSAYESHESLWHLPMVDKLVKYVHVIENRTLKETVEAIINEFVREVKPRLFPSEKQIIHGDFNSQNIVCQEKGNEWRISAIIDFGDSHLSYPMYELAISMCYTMVDCKEKKLNHLLGSGHTLHGYMKTNPILDFSYLLLKQCIAARLCQAFVLGTYNAIVQPENTYISENLNFYSELLMEISETPIYFLQDIWENVANSYNGLA